MELSIVKREARRDKKSVSQWVRELIREKISRQDQAKKVDPVAVFKSLDLPAPPIDQMLREIEEGRQ